MNLYDFNLKSDHDQYDIVFSQGDFIDCCIEDSKIFALYAVGIFFVEIEYDLWNNKIIGKRAFVTGAILDKYSNLGPNF